MGLSLFSQNYVLVRSSYGQVASLAVVGGAAADLASELGSAASEPASEPGIWTRAQIVDV